MDKSNSSNGGAKSRDDMTPEEKHRHHVQRMDELRAREEVCRLVNVRFCQKVKNFQIKFLGRNFECSSSPKRII